MRIIFGINAENGVRSVLYGGAILVLTLTQLEYLNKLDRCQKSIFMSRMPNVTSIDTNLYCDIPYQNCLCSIVSQKYCLTHEQLKISRILPLVLFVLQVYLIRQLFSLSGDHVSFLVHVSWIASVLSFIGILVIVYRNSCYFDFIATILCCTGYALFFLISYAVNLDCRR
jgi:hypothetical protein